MQDFKGNELHVGDRVIFTGMHNFKNVLKKGEIIDIFTHICTKEILCSVKEDNGNVTSIVFSREIVKDGENE